MDTETFAARLEQAVSRIRAALQTLSAAIDGKADPVTGKGLSANDFTAEDMARIDELYNQKYGTQSVLKAGEFFDSSRLTRHEIEIL